jgi:hypothetical protein
MIAGVGRSHLGVALLAFVSTLTNAGLAGEPSSQHDQAVGLFEEGRALIKGGDCANAIVKLKASLALETSVGAHLNLAECYEPSDPLSAWRELKEAEFLTYTHADDRARVAHERAAALEPKLALVRVRATPAVLEVPGLAIQIDGVTFDRFYYQGGPIALPPGRHTVDATSPGKRFSGAVDAKTGATAEIEVVLTDAPPEPPPVTFAPVFMPSPGRRTAALVTGGIGLGGVILGGVFGAVSLYYANQVKDDCQGHISSCGAKNEQQANAADKTANVTAAVSDIGLFGGGALVVTGVVLYLTAPRVPIGEAPQKSVSIVPAIGGGSASLVAVGRF